MQYLIGMGGAYEVFVVRIGPTGGARGLTRSCRRMLCSRVRNGPSRASSRASPAGRTTVISAWRARRHSTSSWRISRSRRRTTAGRPARRARRGARGRDFYPADNGCYCQDDCTCLEACDDSRARRAPGHAAAGQLRASGDAQYSYSYACGEEESAVLACMFDAQASGDGPRRRPLCWDDGRPRTTTTASLRDVRRRPGRAVLRRVLRERAGRVRGFGPEAFECSYEHQAAEVLGLNCTLNCSSTLAPTPAPYGAAPRRPLP